MACILWFRSAKRIIHIWFRARFDVFLYEQNMKIVFSSRMRIFHLRKSLQNKKVNIELVCRTMKNKNSTENNRRYIRSGGQTAIRRIYSIQSSVLFIFMYVILATNYYYWQLFIYVSVCFKCDSLKISQQHQYVYHF